MRPCSSPTGKSSMRMSTCGTSAVSGSAGRGRFAADQPVSSRGVSSRLRKRSQCDANASMSNADRHIAPRGPNTCARSARRNLPPNWPTALPPVNAATRIAALVVHADLRLPNLDAVLDAHERAGKGRVRGVRQSGARLEDPSARLLLGAAPAGLYADPDFVGAWPRLGERGLVFDAFQFHFQLDELRRAGPRRSRHDDRRQPPRRAGRLYRRPGRSAIPSSASGRDTSKIWRASRT